MTGPSSIEPRPVLAPPIFPGRRQPGIVGRNELNYRVRNGNGWTLALIGTNLLVADFESLASGSAGNSLSSANASPACSGGRDELLLQSGKTGKQTEL